MIYCTRTRTFNGWLIRTRPFAHLLIFHVQTTRSHPGLIEDGICLSGERLPRLQRQVLKRQCYIAAHTAAACAVQIFAVFIFKDRSRASIQNIRKFVPFENFLLYGIEVSGRLIGKEGYLLQSGMCCVYASFCASPSDQAPAAAATV